jgi:hypothetical protein
MKVQHWQHGRVGVRSLPELEVDGDAEDCKEHEDDGYHDDFVGHDSKGGERTCGVSEERLKNGAE